MIGGRVPRIVILADLVAELPVRFEFSQPVIVKGKTPLWVGVPERMPRGLKVIPGGRGL